MGDTSLVTVSDVNGQSFVVTKFQERSLVKAMKEGAILLIDEINANDAGFLAVLHGPCDDSRLLSTPNGDIYGNNGFCVIATMNEDYCGIHKINPALVDRMLGIDFKPPLSISKVLLANRPNAPKSLLDYIERVYSKIITLMKDEVIDDSPFSIRGFIDAIDLVEYDFSKEEAIEYSIVNRIQDKEYRDSFRNALEIC